MMTTRVVRVGGVLLPLLLAEAVTGQWEQRTPTTAPPPREAAAMAFDTFRHRVVLFGGAGATGSVLGDTWEWDGTNWTAANPGSSPPPRLHAAMAYDPVRRQIVLFGGADASGRFGDTWTYDGLTWLQRSPNPSPPARRQSGLAWDTAGSRVLLFGGTDGSSLLDDTWSWDGTAWTQHNPGLRPPARWAHGLASEPTSGSVLLFGGHGVSQSNPASLNDTWVWAGNAWSQRMPSTRPNPRGGHAMFVDSSRGRTIVYGGNYFFASFPVALGDTYAWDGSNWVLMTSGVPSARYDVAGADGPTAPVQFGGRAGATVFGETWILRPVPQPVFPQGLERVGGNESYGGTFSSWRSRTQVAMAAAGFDPAFRSGTIRGLRLRRDAVGPGFAARDATMRLYFGLAGRAPSDLSTRFFDNWQGTPTLAFQGVLNIPALPNPGAAVAPFALYMPFAAPFAWAGQTLLYDIEVLENSMVAPLDLDAATQAYAQGSTSRFGQACRGPTGALPVLAPLPLTRLIPGGGIDMSLAGATPGGLAIGILGDNTASYLGIPLPFTFPGSSCTLYTNLVVSSTQVVSGSGTAMASHPIPNDQRFAGVRAYVQWGVYEGPSIYPPLTLTDAIQLTVGANPPVLYDAVLNTDGSNTGVRIPGRFACLVCRLEF